MKLNILECMMEMKKELHEKIIIIIIIIIIVIAIAF